MEKKATRQARERRARIRNGIVGPYDRVPSGAATDAVTRALADGVGSLLLAECAGVTPGTIRDLVTKPDRMILHQTESAVLRGVEIARHRMRFGERAPRRVAVGPYRDKLRRLGAAGWSLKKLLDEAGLPENVVRDRAQFITPEVAQGVDALYAEYESRLGPDLQTARYWRSRGYIVPAAESPRDMLPLPPTERERRAQAALRRSA